jgi:hypothetical protein
MGGDGMYSGLVVENNILYANTDNGIDADGVEDSLFRNNLIYGNGRNALRLFRIDSARGPRNLRIVNNTLLVPSSGGCALKFSEDMAFLNGIPGPATDILGTVRPQGSAYDLGAHESH